MFERLNRTTGGAPMNNGEKPIWLAVIMRGSDLGCPLLVEPRESIQSYRNWAKRRCMPIIGEFRTQQAARARIDA
jgi:hypothetical protein